MLYNYTNLTSAAPEIYPNSKTKLNRTESQSFHKTPNDANKISNNPCTIPIRLNILRLFSTFAVQVPLVTFNLLALRSSHHRISLYLLQRYHPHPRAQITPPRRQRTFRRGLVKQQYATRKKFHASRGGVETSKRGNGLRAR